MEMSNMSNNQKLENDEKTGSDISIDKIMMKESIMDFTGHFSTASAILTGFYMAMCAFIISIKAEGSEIFSFLDEPLLAEISILGDLIKEVLLYLNLSDLWPTHFEYMLAIFISLFLLSLISYACFLWVGMIQMSMYKSNKTISVTKLLTWQQRGMNALLISLLLGFIALPWALFRFITDQALILTFLLFVFVIIGLYLVFKAWTLVKRIPRP